MADYKKSNADLFGDFVKKMNEAGTISQPNSSQPMQGVSFTPPRFNTPASIPSAPVTSAPPVRPIAPTVPDNQSEIQRIQQEINTLRAELNTDSEQAVIERLRNRGDLIAFLCNSMKFIDGGSFRMGNDLSDRRNVKPAHYVRLSSFYCMKYPIPNMLWLAIGEEAPFNDSDFTPASINSINDDFWFFLRRVNAITGLNFDLISEAQWEYVARAGMDDYFNYSCLIDGITAFDDKVQDIGFAKADNLGKPNCWGIYGMNYVRHNSNGWYFGLAEWCKDMLANYPEDSYDWPTDPVVTRGTTRCFRSSDQPVYVRNEGSNKLKGNWREAIWTARLVCKATDEAYDFISSHQTL